MSYIEREAVLKVLENSMEFSIKELKEGKYRSGCIAAIKDDISNISHLPTAVYNSGNFTVMLNPDGTPMSYGEAVK